MWKINTIKVCGPPKGADDCWDLDSFTWIQVPPHQPPGRVEFMKGFESFLKSWNTWWNWAMKNVNELHLIASMFFISFFNIKNSRSRLVSLRRAVSVQEQKPKKERRSEYKKVRSRSVIYVVRVYSARMQQSRSIISWQFNQPPLI